MNVLRKHSVARSVMFSCNLLSDGRFLNPLNNSLLRKKASFGKTLPVNWNQSKVDSFITKFFHVENHFSRCSFCQSKHLTTASVLQSPAVSSQNFHASLSASFQRWFSTSSLAMERLKPEDVRKRVENLTVCFAEARELLGDARESLGSTYFSEDMMEAQEAVSLTVAEYEALLAELEEDQRNDVIRTIGLRMEELKAQEQAIKDLLD